MASNNIETVKKFYEIFMSGKPGNLPTVLDSELRLEMMEGWPYGGKYSGLNSAMENFFPKVWNLLKPFTLGLMSILIRVIQ